jgi:hypothetical protein
MTTVRVLTPVESCCRPLDLALYTGQHATCARNVAWIAVDAIDEGRGDHDWYTKWSVA